MSKNPFAKLEEKLNMVSSVVKEFENEDIMDTLAINEDSTLIGSKPFDIQTKEENTLPASLAQDEEIFTTGLLKQDFLMIRQNIMSLISKGQRLLDSAGDLDATEMKASQIEAISNLSNAISNNLKLLLDSYKQITEIEKNKINKFGNSPEQMQNINTGQITNNNIVFSGSPSDLLNLLKNGA